MKKLICPRIRGTCSARVQAKTNLVGANEPIVAVRSNPRFLSSQIARWLEARREICPYGSRR